MNKSLWEITTTVKTTDIDSVAVFEEESSDKILEQVTCPVCIEIPTSEIYQCTNGHILCSKCLTKVRSCPQCRQKFEKDGIPIRIRARVLEDLLDSVKTPCPYTTQGCTEKFSRKLMDEHKETCIFK